MLAFRRASLLFAVFLAVFDCRAASLQPAEVLRQRITVRWQEVPLRDVCRRLADTQGIIVWIDRRIDPHHRITLQADDRTVRQVLEEVADSCESQLAVLPTFCYLGPREAATELPALLEIAREKMQAAPAALRRKLSRTNKVSWQRLTTPHQILRDLTEPFEVKVSGLERIPHDLLDAGELPAATAAEQLAFFLSQFDRTWRIEDAGKRIEIVPIDRPVRIARTYRWRGTQDARLERVLAQIPAANVRVAEGKVTVNGTVQEHEKLHELLASLPRSPRTPRRPSRPAQERKLFSLRLQDQPTGAILRELARQLNLQVQVAEAAEASLETRISIDVTQVELDVLLEKIGNAAGLVVTAKENELKVAPR